ncbi:MAG: LacI family DNA-binding transcriptional regulator [Chitinophagaceae bacterium]|nr:LacI family DNA-binding transcriptional regulator [Chitinophagaceae bacterium]
MQSPDSQKDITIYDLAARLGLSIATISRALNGEASVSPRTKKRVFEMAASLGYRMNDSARMLRSGRSNTIGCIVPQLNTHRMSAIVSAMEETARQQAYCLLVMQSLGSKEIEAICANLLFNKRVDALMVVPSEKTAGNMQHFDPFLKRDIPVILIDSGEEKHPFVNISTDNHKAGYDMTRHLLVRGCRQIVHITSSGSLPVYAGLCAGYRQAMTESGIPVKDHHIIPCALTREDGIHTIRTIWQQRKKPDAIFAASDECAAGCISALKEKGICIPGEIAVAGFGNDPVSLMTEPPLTTIDYPGHHIGKAAVHQMMDRLQEKTSSRTVAAIVLRSGLIIRKSTLIC